MMVSSAVIGCSGTPNRTGRRRRRKKKKKRGDGESDRQIDWLCGRAVSVALVAMYPNSAEFRIRLL